MNIHNPNRRKQQLRRVARVVLPTLLIGVALCACYAAMLFAWLTATPGDPAPRERAFWWSCAAAPLSLLAAAWIIIALRPRPQPPGTAGSSSDTSPAAHPQQSQQACTGCGKSTLTPP